MHGKGEEGSDVGAYLSGDGCIRDGVRRRYRDGARLVLPMRGLSLPLTSAIQHDLARLPPNVLPHDRERHVGWQDRIVARDLSQIVRLWVGLTFVDFEQVFAFVPLPRPEGVSGMTMTTTSCEGSGKARRSPGRSTEPPRFPWTLRHSQVFMSDEDHIEGGGVCVC